MKALLVVSILSLSVLVLAGCPTNENGPVTPPNVGFDQQAPPLGPYVNVLTQGHNSLLTSIYAGNESLCNLFYDIPWDVNESDFDLGLVVYFDDQGSVGYFQTTGFIRAPLDFNVQIPSSVQKVRMIVVGKYPEMPTSLYSLFISGTGLFNWGKLDQWAFTMDGQTVTANAGGYWEFDNPYYNQNPPEPDTLPVITGQPVSQTVQMGASVTFSVTATGNNLSYQWLKNGLEITGATSSVFMISPAALNDAGNYSCRVSNSAGDVTSDEATLTVNNPPNEHSLTTVVSGQGSISPIDGSYPDGTVVNITATPANGWHFDHWEGDITGSVNPTTIVMDDNKLARAVFLQTVIPENKITVDLVWNAEAGQLTFSADAAPYPSNGFIGIANQSGISSVGLELYHQIGGAPWIERQTFAFSDWPVMGNVTDFRPPVLRFEVVANASGGYGDIMSLEVRINGQVVPRVTDTNGHTAYQVDVSAL